MSFTKLRLRMERQRNSTSHQNILPSTALLLRNTRSGQDSVINKLPTLLGVLKHKHSPQASLEQQKNIKREDKVQPVNRLSADSHACRWGQYTIMGRWYLFVRGICLATAQTSCQLLSANPDALRGQGAGSKTMWRHRDQTQTLYCNLKQGYHKPEMQLQQTSIVRQESLL